MSMKKMMIYGCFLVLTMLSCNKPDIRLDNPNDALRPAAEFARNNYAFSLLSAAIVKAGLGEELNKPGPLTIWAPTDAAFNRIGIRSPEDFDNYDTESLRKLVLSHVQPGKLMVESIPIGTVNNRYDNAAGSNSWLARIDITAVPTNPNRTIRAYVNGAQVGIDNRYNIPLSNGVFHEISEVLKYEDVSVREWLEKKGHYKVLVAGLKHFGYWDMLTDDKQWTIMAPADSIFERQGMTVESVTELDTAVYGKRLFGAYIFPVRFFVSDLELFKHKLFIGSGAFVELGVYTPIMGDEKFSNGISSVVNRFNGPGFFVNKTFPQESWELTYAVSYPDYRSNWNLSNHLTRNGCIHHLGGVVLLPYQAHD